MTISTEIYPMLSETIPPKSKKHRRPRVLLYCGQCVTFLLLAAVVATLIYVHMFQPLDQSEFKLLNKSLQTLEEVDELVKLINVTDYDERIDNRLETLDAKITLLFKNVNAHFEILSRYQNQTLFSTNMEMKLINDRINTLSNALTLSKLSYNEISKIVNNRVEMLMKNFSQEIYLPFMHRIDNSILNLTRLMFFENGAETLTEDSLSVKINKIFDDERV